jgi:hypothetical protein
MVPWYTMFSMSTRSRRLPEALDASQVLFEPRRIPRKVDVDEHTEGPQVEAFAGRIGRDDQLDLLFFDASLDTLPFAVDKNAGPSWLSRTVRTQIIRPDPCRKTRAGKRGYGRGSQRGTRRRHQTRHGGLTISRMPHPKHMEKSATQLRSAETRLLCDAPLSIKVVAPNQI